MIYSFGVFEEQEIVKKSLRHPPGTMTVVGPAVRWTAAQAYSASRINVLGGRGLIFPQNSIPYNQILNGSLRTTLAEGGWGYADGALAQGFFLEMEALGNGTCQ